LYKEKKLNIILAVLVTASFSIMPHAPSFSPFLAFCFLGHSIFQKKIFPIVACLFVINNYALYLAYDLPFFGPWLYFMLSGYLAVTWFGKVAKDKSLPPALIIFPASFIYWFWTNLGAFLNANVYEKTATGFMTCYIDALPLLNHSMLGDFCWLIIIKMILGELSFRRMGRIFYSRTS